MLGSLYLLIAIMKDDFNIFIAKETTKLKSLGLEEVELEKRLEKATKQEEARLKDKGYKLLSIANPIHGEDFFALLYNLKWDDTSMVRITRDKLYALCSSKLPPQRYKSLFLFIFAAISSLVLSHLNMGYVNSSTIGLEISL